MRSPLLALLALSLAPPLAGAQTVLVELPAEPPARLQVPVERDGQVLTLDLEQHSDRAPDFRVLVSGPRGALTEVVVPPLATYSGTVLEQPGSIVIARLHAGELTARVLDGGSEWTLGQHPAPEREPACVAHPKFVPRAGQLAVGAASAPPPVPAVTPPLVDGIDFSCLTRARIAFDADFEYFAAYGSVATTVQRIEQVLAEVNAFYERDVKITHQLGTVVVRTSPYYTPTGGGDLLDQFRSEWNTTLAAEPRDMAHLMTGKSGSLIEFGGLAWVAAVCTNYHFGWSMDGANIVGHELGHNWGSGHCIDASPCNNMCGACFLITPLTREVIAAYRDSVGCLERIGPGSLAVAPYVLPESAQLNKADFAAPPELVFDVLANDDDGNCDALSIAGFDAFSERGGLVAQSGAFLTYQLPPVPFAGSDRFEYIVTDPTGRTSVGEVRVDLAPKAMRAYWTFDEGQGDVAWDTSGAGLQATGAFPLTWTAGVHGSALELPALGQELVTGADDFAGPWSFTAWIRRDAPIAPAATLMQSSDGALRIAQWPFTGRLGVTRWGVADWSYPAAAPLGLWAHVAFVSDGVVTRLYLNGIDEGTVPGTIRAPMGPISRIEDSMGGALDDLRVFNHALQPAEVLALYASDGANQLLAPADGGSRAGDYVPLEFQPGALADDHRLFLGPDYFAVRDAVPGAPEDLGVQTGSALLPSGLSEAITYYWRADKRVGSTIILGDVWAFTPTVLEHYRLDDPISVLALEAGGGTPGAYSGAPTMLQPGATAALGTSVAFDGIDDHVVLPAFDLDTDRVTLTCWLRRDGDQNDWSGLIFTRDGSSVAGLNLGVDNELRYHWNGSGNTYGFDSGLVTPDDTWVFAALVVEPERATLYLGQDGALTSAVNEVGHGPEEFDGQVDIARDRSSNARRFRGRIDDVRIHAHAFSPAEIAALYQSSL